jgi:hypothetical protein
VGNGANGTCGGGASVECSASIHTTCQVTTCGGSAYYCTNAGGTWHWSTSASCSDGNLCTYNEACSGGSCTGGTVVNCDASDTQCADYSCDGDATCAVSYSTSACNDGDACTTGETCNGAGSCAGGTSAAVCGDTVCNCGETSASCPADCTVACSLPVTIGAFDTGADGWTTTANWAYSSTGGASGGYMRFDDESPSHLTGYSRAVTSPVRDLSGCTAASLRYSVKLDDYTDSWYGDDEYMRAQCSGNGSSWTTLASYLDGDDSWNEDFGWTQYTHVLPAGCRTATSYIRFLSEGDDSWNFDFWGIDSVSLQP